MQILRNVAEYSVLYAARLSVVDEKPGRIPRLGGRLRDEFFGQIVIIIGFFQHNLTFFVRS